MKERFSCNVAMFGEEGQALLRSNSVAVVGVGGLGTHVVQQLALLGVGTLSLIDPEELDETNRNRYVGVLATDPIPGTRKVDVGERIARGIDPGINVIKVADDFVSETGFDALGKADFVFGCLDTDGCRLMLNEFCSAYLKAYIDLASDVDPGKPLTYGGRVLVNVCGMGCLVCMDELDAEQARLELASPGENDDHRAIYGVERALLSRSGPSVVSINGVIASLGVTEFLVAVTGLREPAKLLTYYGDGPIMRRRIDTPSPNCWYCGELRGQGAQANVERYIRQP